LVPPAIGDDINILADKLVGWDKCEDNRVTKQDVRDACDSAIDVAHVSPVAR
jgi:hypothetical protein